MCRFDFLCIHVLPVPLSEPEPDGVFLRVRLRAAGADDEHMIHSVSTRLLMNVHCEQDHVPSPPPPSPPPDNEVFFRLASPGNEVLFIRASPGNEVLFNLASPGNEVLFRLASPGRADAVLWRE
jgi:hypothetical protein